jgi:hypothetical protein
MTTPERIKALQCFGYDLNEAHFICVAALHSGYFLRRQFLFFAGGTKGWKDVAFLNKLRLNRHCRVTVYRHNRMVYHLSAKPLYDALGEKDNRNRREHQPSTIKNKIMGLDFVLEHSEFRYLATENEKLDYFLRVLKLVAEDLPTRWYESPRKHEATAKHFADKYPMFLSTSSGGTTPLVHFCYIDEGMQSTDRFETHLELYSRLFRALPDFRLIYVAQHDHLFEAAREIFEQFGHPLGGPTVAQQAHTQQILDYFRMRREYKARDFSQFDTARLIRYREAKKQFSEERFEGLYEQWLLTGTAAGLINPALDSDLEETQVERFSTYVLNHDYDLFGTLTKQPVAQHLAAGDQTQA